MDTMYVCLCVCMHIISCDSGSFLVLYLHTFIHTVPTALVHALECPSNRRPQQCLSFGALAAKCQL